MLSVAEMPTTPQKKQLEEKITQLFGKEIRYEYQAIPTLIGGFVATVQDTLQIDASVSTQVSKIHKTLKDSTLKGDV
jgi:F0F1-type ATP synthase delta subunit